MPKEPCSYGVIIVTRDERTCDILLELGKRFGRAVPRGVVPLAVENFYPLPQVARTFTGISCINASHPALEAHQQITLFVDNPFEAAEAYQKAFIDSGIACETGDLQKIRPHLPPGLLAYVLVEDIRLTLYPPQMKTAEEAGD